MESKIIKVTLQLGKKEIELTLDEVKQLKQEVDKVLIGQKEYIPYNPYPYYPSHWPLKYTDSGIWYGGVGCTTASCTTVKNNDNLTYTKVGN